VRVIGQAPVVAKDIFDMVSDGKEFRIYIPSRKTRSWSGPRRSRALRSKPIENLRPQAYRGGPVLAGITQGRNVLFEQFDFNREPLLHPDAAAAMGTEENSKSREKSGTTAPTCAFPASNCLEREGRLIPTSHIRTGSLWSNAARRAAPPDCAAEQVLRAISTSGAPRTITNSKSTS
jgi:hypothetical protein